MERPGELGPVRGLLHIAELLEQLAEVDELPLGAMGPCAQAHGVLDEVVHGAALQAGRHLLQAPAQFLVVQHPWVVEAIRHDDLIAHLGAGEHLAGLAGPLGVLQLLLQLSLP